MTHSVPRFALLRVRRFCADPLALLPLSLPDARWRTCARAGHPAASRRCKGAVVGWIAGRSGRERQGLCPLVPQTGIDTPVWRAVPAGPRQGIDSGFPSPSHPRRKAGRMPRVGCGFQPKEGRRWVI